MIPQLILLTFKGKKLLLFKDDHFFHGTSKNYYLKIFSTNSDFFRVEHPTVQQSSAPLYPSLAVKQKNVQGKQG